MSMQDVIDRVKQLSHSIKEKLTVEMVILQSNYQGEEGRADGIIDVAVVVDLLKADQDYIEVRDQLARTAQRIDPRMEIDLIESERGDPTGFFNEIRKTGRVIYEKTRQS